MFSEQGNQRVSALREKLGVSFEYYDPNGSYEDDVMAYTNALKDMAKSLAPYYPVFAEVL